jgi:uracil-DNA glycosylase
MADNQKLGIPYIPIYPKPNAKFVFIGRDPSPRTATCVGVRGGRSVFINEVFALADDAGIPEEAIYITDVCKCHWRTSRGKPWEGTKDRSTFLPTDVAEVCVRTWLFKEIHILNPKLILSFGEELYQLLKRYLIEPNPVPEKLSATTDKSQMDAELHFSKNGPFKIRLGSILSDFVPLRHPGNSTSLIRSVPSDKRWQAHQESRRRVVKLLRAGCA